MGEVLHVAGLLAAGGLAMAAGVWFGVRLARRNVREVLEQHALVIRRRARRAKTEETRRACIAQADGLVVLASALEDRGLI